MAATNDDYTDQAMQNHVKTYNGFLTLLKIGIAVSVFALLILTIVYNV